MAAALAAAVTSDHINLMILRYLEEQGHENTATAFWRDWHRPNGHRDPETLPFAASIGRGELVTVIQHGIYFDELQARARKGTRRFQWTSSTPQAQIDRDDAAIESAVPARTKSRLHAPIENEFPTPTAKRVRRNDATEPIVNGDHDAMDVDGGSAEADEERDAISPTAPSELDTNAVAERYDSMDAATQTIVNSGPKTSVMHWEMDKSDANILHAIWSPHTSNDNTNTLLTVGTSLCRFYHVPRTTETSDQLSRVDATSIPDNFLVTASAWRPDGAGIACSVDADQDSEPTNMLVECSSLGDGHARPQPAAFQDSSSVVLSMAYSLDAQHLLICRTGLDGGSFQIWDATQSHTAASTTSSAPQAWHVLDEQILDATWVSDDTVLICGDNGLSSLYQLHSEEDMATNGDASNGAVNKPHGVKALKTALLSHKLRWDKLCYHQNLKIAALASIESRKIVLTYPLSTVADQSKAITEIDLPGELTELEFQQGHHVPEGTTDEDSGEALLAATFATGKCIIYSIGAIHPTTTISSKAIVTLAMADGPASAISWSPNGDHLAVANTEITQIWAVDGFRRKNGTIPGTKPLITWREDFETESLTNGNIEEEERTVIGPSLSYSADGQCLAFIVDKHIAVMCFHPSSTDTAVAETSDVMVAD